MYDTKTTTKCRLIMVGKQFLMTLSDLEIEYGGGKVLQRWHGSGGNVRLSHLQLSLLIRFV